MTVGLGPNGTGKLRLVKPGVLLHWCPGCGEGHTIDVHEMSRNGHVLGWDGDIYLPSVAEPIERVTARGRCAYRLKAGIIYFESDCWHHLANQQRHLEEYPL